MRRSAVPQFTATSLLPLRGSAAPSAWSQVKRVMGSGEYWFQWNQRSCFHYICMSECSPGPNGPHNSVTQERICQEEEEQLRKKKEAKKKRRKNKEVQVQKQRKLVKERGAEQEPQRLELERVEEKWWKQTEETERKRREEEEARRRKEAMERKAREMERHLEEEIRRQEEKLRKKLQALMEDEEVQLEEELKERLEEVDEWMEKVIEKEEEEEEQLRGDVFQLPPSAEEAEPDMSNGAAAETGLKMMEVEEEELVENHSGLPPGCDISDVTVTCDSLKLTYFPPLSIIELKSLSLEGESPAHTFLPFHFHLTVDEI